MQQRPQDEARPVLALAKPGAGSGFGSRLLLAKAEQARFVAEGPNRVKASAFGLYFPTGKSPQLETRREMAVDSGRDARLVRNRPGETRSASPGLSGKAKVAVPVLVSPFPGAKGGSGQARSLRWRSSGGDSGETAAGQEPTAARPSPERSSA